MRPQTQYVNRILDQYVKLPGTLRRVLRNDRRTALALYRRGVRLDVVENAFVLALARRNFRTDVDQLQPIRCLQYHAGSRIMPSGRAASRGSCR